MPGAFSRAKPCFADLPVQLLRGGAPAGGQPPADAQQGLHVLCPVSRLHLGQQAEILEISQIHLANIEGGRRNPSVPLLFQMMELLDFSVDGLVFPQGEGEPVLHTQGLSPREVEALSRLIDAMRERE